MALYELDGVRVTTPGSGRYWVAPNAIVLGKVELCEDASVWFGAVLRGDNELIRDRCPLERAGWRGPPHRPRLPARHRRGLHDRPHGHAARLHDRPRAA